MGRCALSAQNGSSAKLLEWAEMRCQKWNAATLHTLHLGTAAQNYRNHNNRQRKIRTSFCCPMNEPHIPQDGFKPSSGAISSKKRENRA
jgi:hypothetical protein